MLDAGLAEAFCRGITPPPVYGCAEWCENEYYLPAESAAEPGLISFKRTPYSYGIMEAMDDPNVEFVSLQMAAQLAKDLALDTKIPTPTGFTTMRDVSVGDEVLDHLGRATLVTHKSHVWKGRKCFKVKFNDGSEIVAGDTHEWYVTSPSFRRSNERNSPMHSWEAGRVLTTQDMFDAGVNYGNRFRFHIPVAPATETPGVDLPIDPYLLGVWLGDGTSDCGQITSCIGGDVGSLFSEMARAGVSSSNAVRDARSKAVRVSTSFGPDGRTFTSHLSEMGLIGNKHIPELYSFASIEQRWELVRGLMDSDGTVAKGRCNLSITQKSPRLAREIQSLLASLGHVATIKTINIKLKDGGMGAYHKLTFSSENPRGFFKLKRKKDACGPCRRSSDFRTRRVVSIEPVEPTDTACIKVASGKSLFLAGENFIPTHNTTILLGAMGQICATPGMGAPVLFLLPTLDNCEMLSKERFGPMIEASPALKRNTIANAKGKGSQTTLKKSFTNGAIVNFVGSNAPAALASRPVKMLLADECDRFAASAGAEGDPLQLAIKRTSTFRKNGRKIVVTSTPTLAGISVIERQYKLSDQREYFCPCPHCGEKHVLAFENIKWENNDPETAYYPCPDCGTLWSEADRLTAVANGVWIAQRPEVKGHAGFKLNALASPWVGEWSNAVKEFLNSRGDPMQEQVFVNTYLGETYSSDDLNLDEQAIIDRMTGIGLEIIPAECLLLTAGVDVQRDRFEVQIVGWTESGQAYILDHRKIYGDTSGVQAWKDLNDFLQSDFQHELGNRIEIRATAIDSGYLTQSVYDFVDDNPYSGYFAIKGVHGERLIWEQSQMKKKGGSKLWLVGVDDCKTHLMETLKNGDSSKPNYIHITDMGAESQEFAKQLLSEYRAVSYVGNRPTLKWERKSTGHRAEVLDCYCYALAVRTSLSPNWENLRYELTLIPDDDDDEDDGWHVF